MVAQVSDVSLLPSTATDQERAIDLATGRISAVPVPIRELWNADTCPSDKLAWLAWAWGVDEWSDSWPDESKRTTIRDALEVQKRKGSVWSIRRVMANAGYGQVEIVEGLYANLYNGVASYNGFITHGDPTQWATYRIVLERPISNAQAAQVRRILETTAPARSKLIEFVFVEASNLYNNTIRYDGTYNHGTA